MAVDFTNITVGANGSVYVAPTTAVMPTTASEALSGDWLDLGTISENGASFALTRNITTIGAWQSQYPARRIVDGIEGVVSFVARESNKTVVEFALGTTITGGGGTQEVQSVVLSAFAGTDSYHLTYGGSESATITRGTNHDAAGIKAAIEGITGVTFTVTVSSITDDGFIVTFAGLVNRTPLSVTNPTGCTGVVGTLVQGSAPAGTDYVATPNSASTVDERALLVSWQDGVKNFGILVPRGIVTGSITMSMMRTGPVDIPVEFSATPGAGDDPFRQLSDATSWA